MERHLESRRCRRPVRNRTTHARLLLDALEDRTVPSAGPSALPEITLLDPIPVVVAGQPPDSPAAHVNSNTTDSPYAGVVSLFVTTAQGTFLGSGTAIDPLHIISAAHVVDTNDDGQL